MTTIEELKTILRNVNKSVKVYSIAERQSSGGTKLDVVMDFLNDGMINEMLEHGYDFSYVDVQTATKLRVVFDKLEKFEK